MVTVQPFVYQAAPSRVIFGPGTIKQLGAELERQDVKLPLLLSTPQQVEQVHAIATQLDGKIAGIFSEATMHTPTDVTDKALRFIKKKRQTLLSALEVAARLVWERPSASEQICRTFASRQPMLGVR
jgi:alcohol dehydrogenase class IV